MNEAPERTSVEFIDALLLVVRKFEDTLLAARSCFDCSVEDDDLFRVDEDVREDKEAPPDKVARVTLDQNARIVDISDVEPTRVEEWSAKPARRARVTPELNAKIIGALVDRVPRPRMVDVAEEFGVSQATVSRLFGIYRSEVSAPKTADSTLPDGAPIDDDGESPVPLSANDMSLPIISEGRKPSLED